MKERLPLVEDRVRSRLKQLSARPGDADWLRLKSSGILNEYPNLAAYFSPAVKRGLPTDRLSRLNWRSTPASRRPADEIRSGLELSSEFSFSVLVLTLAPAARTTN
jgi:hypothetical protein